MRAETLRDAVIALIALGAIVVHLVLRFSGAAASFQNQCWVRAA